MTPDGTVTLLLAGDVMTGRGVDQALRHHAPWPPKDVPYRVHPGSVDMLTAAHLDVCTRANNRALDWGHGALHPAGIASAGAVVLQHWGGNWVPEVPAEAYRRRGIGRRRAAAASRPGGWVAHAGGGRVVAAGSGMTRAEAPRARHASPHRAGAEGVCFGAFVASFMAWRC